MQRQDLITVNGDYEAWPLILKDGANVPVDLTGSTVTFTIRDASGTILLPAKVITTHTDPVNGATVIILNTGDTQHLPTTDHRYDIQIDFANGQRKTLFKGVFTIENGVTQNP